MTKNNFLFFYRNIGAGKSTFLNILNKSLGMEFEVVPEPLEEWLSNFLLIKFFSYNFLIKI